MALPEQPTTPPATPPADGEQPTTPPAGGEQPTDMSMADMMAGLKEVVQEPEYADDMDPAMRAVMEQNYAHELRFKFDDFQRESKGQFPDITDTLAHNMGMAMAKGDFPELIKHVRDAIKREQEADEKSEEQKSLHVEGGASGKPDEEKLTGLGGVFAKIASDARSTAA